MRKATAQELLEARRRLEALSYETRGRMARFRDGLPVRYVDLRVLEGAGLVYAPDGEHFVALPGVLEVFADMCGAAVGREHSVRMVTGGSRAVKDALFSTIPGAVRCAPAGKAEEDRPVRAPDPSARVLAVPAPRLTPLHPRDWRAVHEASLVPWPSTAQPKERRR